MRAIPLEPSDWRVAASEHRFAEHLGRRTLWLHDGFAFAEGVAFRDGSLAFDIALTPERTCSTTWPRSRPRTRSSASTGPSASPPPAASA